MPGRKRVAQDAAGDTGSSPRATKSARTKKNDDGSKKAGKKSSAKTAAPTLSSNDFKAKALPLHLSLTHTPPTIEEESTDTKAEGEGSPSGDPGFIGNLTLVPNVFSTGSYGWKGSKRMTIELQNGETDSDGLKEKVQVMLTVNATVVGSKNADGKKGKDTGKIEDEEGDKDDPEENVGRSELETEAPE